MTDEVPVHFENYFEPWDQWFDISAYPSPEGLAVYFRDITERKRSEAALLRLNEDLKQFTYAATHDIREPLRMITIYMDMLQRKLGDQLDSQARSYITEVVSGAQRISRLIDGLLQFSRIGEIDAAQSSPVDTEAALEEALNDLQIAIGETDAKVTHDPLPKVTGEPARLSQLFQNLIANALKYHRPGTPPQIHVSARRDGTQWIIAVQDNGMGIAPEHQAQIFVPFKRLHGAEIAGAGIGLATCKRIVEKYGGRIWVESTEGKGSIFSFSLPVMDDTAKAGKAG
jgi:light-regulated signal transduction histidine kinase (bacteriophytochrome)